MVTSAQPEHASLVEPAALVVVAAGTGRRLGAAEHKALVPLAGTPLLDHTLRRLLAVPALDPVVVVIHPDDREVVAALSTHWPRPVTLVDGGARRQDSVRAGLAALPDAPDPADVVLVHDAARPFPPTETFGELVGAAREAGCAILALPVADTLREGRADRPDRGARTVPRDRLWAVQTPQAFRRAELLARLDEADRKGVSVTDEAHLFETGGLEVAFVKGSPFNFKITTGEDLRLAEAVLAMASTEART